MTTFSTQGLASCNTSARRLLCSGAARQYRESCEGTDLRALSHYSASTSHNTQALSMGLRRHNLCSLPRRVAAHALFDPPPFQPEKLAVVLAAGTTALEPAPPLSRKYTLTHNDITGNLRLTIGPDYNEKQVSGLYSRLLRDEVVAEWVSIGTSGFALHVYCHVSGEERWLAPPLLRNYIFRREMPLVLDTLVYADQQLLGAQPELAHAQVYVHFQSSVKELDTVESWGILGDRITWPKGPTSILLRMIYAVVGWPQYMPPQPADLSVDLPTDIRCVEEAMRLQELRSATAAELELPVQKQQGRGSDAEAAEDDRVQMRGHPAQAWSRPQQLTLERRPQAGWQQVEKAGQIELLSLEERIQVAAEPGQQQLEAMQAQGCTVEASQAVRSRFSQSSSDFERLQIWQQERQLAGCKEPMLVTRSWRLYPSGPITGPSRLGAPTGAEGRGECAGADR